MSHEPMTLKVAGFLPVVYRRLSDAGVESPLIDAAILMGQAFGQSRLWVIEHAGDPLTQAQIDRIWELACRRADREPMAYILAHKPFFDRLIQVTPAVLIPRPETEILVERALGLILDSDRDLVCLDIGTGSGCIPVAVAARLADANRAICFDATDCSSEALQIARRNAGRYGVEGAIRFFEADLYPDSARSYDLILSNPPYIRTADIDSLQPEISRYEPRLALDGGPDGLRVIARIVAQAPGRLNPGGVLLLEIGAGQAEAVSRMALEAGLSVSGVIPDLAGIPRVAELLLP